MKIFVSQMLIFLLELVLLSAIFTFSHCSALPQGKGGDLIDRTCRQTPYYSLCVSALRSNPKSSHADVVGLALIMVDIISAKSTETLQRINQLRKGSRDPKLQQSLARCAEMYDAVLKADMPVAVEALTKGDYKFAEGGAADAAIEADSCERQFGTKSPVSESNKRVHDLCVVAASIVRILL